ncbi:MAG: DUF262 domain-containing protein [Gammaproteobacteria bacterium]|nr:DUF262 domain-containing protein [Gammaproteobacteria bacterium]MYE29171.1 DUF262 domain-containing protein [Gammaproteobacteria bacterium]
MTEEEKVLTSPSLGEEPPEPEGLDEGEPIELGDYPLDSLMIRTDRRSAFEVCRRIDSEIYILDPDFQREFIWDEGKQCKLIESAIMRIPLPVFYLAETTEGKIVVVDGLQRLSTFHRFLKNKLRLRGLEYAKTLNGKRFLDLSPKLRNRVEDTSLTLYLIDSQVPEQAKLDIFERVNSGQPLTKQQMRNCLYLGEATQWLRRMAKSGAFKSATDKGLNWKTMRDRECINRFLAFYDRGLNGYTGNMDNFLRDVLGDKRAMGDAYWQEMTSRFMLSMEISKRIFGRDAFRKPRGEGERRSVINVALFDVFSVLFAKHGDSIKPEFDDLIRRGLAELVGQEDYFDAISFATNGVKKVALRFERTETMILGALL